MAADYEKASGNKVDHSLIPYAALRQKAISAITSGVVPDMIEVADFALAPIQSWDDKLIHVNDIVEPEKEQFIPTALSCCYFYNNVTKKRAYYVVPVRIAAVPFHIWKSLVEKGGSKISDLPKTWDAFMDFFKPVQKGLRAAGKRNVYGLGYQLTTNGVDPINTFNAWMVAYGGQDLVTPDGKLHTDDPKVKAAAVQAIKSLTSAFKDGYVPPSCVNWNDADDNNAFHSKLMVMDFDGTISTEVALYHDKEQYDDILTHGLPLSNDGKELPSQVAVFGPVIPKGAKNVDGGQGIRQIRHSAEGAEPVFESWARPLGPADPRNRQERPVLAQGGPSPHGVHDAVGDRPDLSDLRGVQSGDGAGRRRTRHHDGGVCCHEQRCRAGAGNRQGIQADRGDLR